jgi:pimeloyl-ACP methyl ester carboxylesterase
VKGIVADCPYASALDVILYVGRTNPIPQYLIRLFVILGAKIFGGFDIQEIDAYRAVKNAKIPILIIHGEADTFVPAQMSNLTLHNPHLIKRITIPGAEHGISYLVDTPRYQKLVREFVSSVL